MAQRQKVIIAMGSNHDAEFHISVARTHIIHLFGQVEFSSVRWTYPSPPHRKASPDPSKRRESLTDSPIASPLPLEGSGESSVNQEHLYLNCLATAYTTHALKSLERALKNLERRCGDSKHERKKGVVNMDLDILLYGDEKKHVGDWERSYVKELMRELKE